ncbi:cytosine deaminase CodA [Cyanobacterium sp. HL-69]|uniref:cytosine deaminase n=1 Tax=Cyanobacterium sp. HL-69 TaxID=2054282 RepID=UPI000CA1EB26|nr:cytosine deaminase CodA [Cyanobacterium sp. HL-69]
MNNKYWLKNAHIPLDLIENSTIKFEQKTRENLVLCDIEIEGEKIKQIIPANDNTQGKDLKKGIVLPCFIDIHTHLDKGHIYQRSPNLKGDFETALKMARNDAKFWNPEEVYERMNFGLKCSYVHGAIALRTHLDCYSYDSFMSVEIWKQLQKEWQNKLTIQAVSLVSLDYFLTPDGAKLADKMAEKEGILGGVAYMNKDVDKQIETVFKLAIERNLDLDFHADENNEIDSICLQKIAKTAIKMNYQGNIICGHCCSLAVQPPEVVKKTIELVKQANISIVSLPMCNLYLQDRQEETTPFWRGVTRAKELKNAGINVAFASDNCRDPFFGFGDHDMLEVFTQSVRIAHLDTPYSDWIASVTKTPAKMIKLPHLGIISVGSTADLIVFKGRYFSELLSRNQCDRTLIRDGKIVDAQLPDYEELDKFINGEK